LYLFQFYRYESVFIIITGTLMSWMFLFYAPFWKNSNIRDIYTVQTFENSVLNKCFVLTVLRKC
jgi:hypothetical protein